jgi:serine/threonine protein kinase
MKLSDLGLAKKKTKEGCFSQSAIRGTPLWMAPEKLEDFDSMSVTLDEETVQTDTFSTGCVFFYFLTRRWHPFNKKKEIVNEKHAELVKNNTITNNPVKLVSKKGKCCFYWRSASWHL